MTTNDQNKHFYSQQRELETARERLQSLNAENTQLREAVRQRDDAIHQIQGALSFRVMMKLRDAGMKLGLNRVLGIARHVKHMRDAAPAMPSPTPDTAPQREFDYDHMLSTEEFRFFEYSRRRTEQYGALLSEMQSPCVKDLVSVVLPVYNGDDLVALSIESVLNQTYRNFEFIIVDDGSTDTTPAIVDAYAAKDSRIRAVHQKNQKLPKTLSNGFALARGEFLTWTSADNIMHPDFLEKLVAEMKAHPQTGMVYADLALIDEKGDPLLDFKWYPDPLSPDVVHLPDCVLELNTVANNHVAAAFLYRASVAHALGNYSTNRYTTEDYDYWMRVNECFNLRHTTFRDPIYDYRFHSNSLTSKDKELKISANRYRLMLWDTFRRGYLLRPMTWSFSGESPVRAALEEELRAAGHRIVSDANERELLCRSDYTATIHVSFDGASADPEALPEGCYKVCVCERPRAVSGNWDCFVSLSDVQPSDFLEDHKGWFAFASPRALFAFLDIRAKGDFLFRMETLVESPRAWEREITVVVSHRGEPESLYETLESLAGQTVQGSFEIIVSAPFCYLSDARNAFERIWQNKKLDASALRFVASDTEAQCDTANAALWAARGRNIVFADTDHLYADGFLQNILTALRLYPDAVFVSGDQADGFEMPYKAEFVCLDSAEQYRANGCIAFNTNELMLAGGFQTELDVPGADIPSGWELLPVCRLLANNRFGVQTNALRRMPREGQNREEEILRARISNLLMNQAEGLLPITFWPERLTNAPSRSLVWNEITDGTSFAGETVKDALLDELLKQMREYFTLRADFEAARTLYTRHWEDADGSMRGVKPLEWLEENMEAVSVPWISVIVPVYRVEKYLARCVNSLRVQTLKNIEIILVDDGSPDDCPRMCDDFAQQDRRIRVIHKTNGGLSDARNAGIDAASGEYLAFIDSDDWIEADMFEQLLYAARLCGAQIAECGFENIYPDKIVPETANTGKWYLADRERALREEMRWGVFKSIACNKIYHKGIFADGKRYPVGKYHEDEFFTHLAFYEAVRLVYVDRVLYHYDRTREESITGKAFNVNALDSVEALRQRCAFFREKKEERLYVQALDLYCWMALEKLKKCEENHLSGARVDQVKAWLKEDLTEMEHAGISEEKLNSVRLLVS